MNDIYHYAVVDYAATGEGRSISVLITRAYPSRDDYEELPSVENRYAGKIKGDVKDIVRREMESHVGSYFIIGIEHLEREEFLKRWGKFIPSVVVDMSDYEANKDKTFGNPRNLNYFATFHYNFS